MLQILTKLATKDIHKLAPENLTF